MVKANMYDVCVCNGLSDVCVYAIIYVRVRENVLFVECVPKGA